MTYMYRVCNDLMQINLALIRARKALDALPFDERVDIVSARLAGQAFDAIVTAHTLADGLLREIPIAELKQ